MRSLRLAPCLVVGTVLLAACKHAPPSYGPEPGSDPDSAGVMILAPVPGSAPAEPGVEPAREAAFREPAAAAAGASDGAITCSFHWRKSVSHEFRPRDEKLVRLAAAGQSRAIELGDARVGVALEDNALGGQRLVVGIDLGTTEIDDDFDFGAASRPSHLPPGGHGFTGLHYLTHPGSGSELQYWCESAGVAAAGPASAAGTAIMCEGVVVAGGEASNAFHVLDTAGAKGSFDGPSLTTRLGALQLGVRYMPGRYESGGVLLGVGSAKGEGSLVHVLYQLHDEDLPANLFSGTFGFTGRTTVHDTASGERAEYGCWAVG